MAQLLVRDLEDAVKSRLQRRARRNGRSMEDEVRHILRQAIASEDRSVAKLGSRIAQRFRAGGLTAELPELKGRGVRPAEFDR